jgi:hypothetical protein
MLAFDGSLSKFGSYDCTIIAAFIAAVVRGIAIFLNGRILAGASFDGTALLWNFENG